MHFVGDHNTVFRYPRAQSLLGSKAGQMQGAEFNKRNFDRTWADLNAELAVLEKREGLGAALAALCEQQSSIGFVQDSLVLVEWHRFDHPDDNSRFFYVQYNPKRAHRFHGTGRTAPPADIEVINHGCFLCRDNIQWQQSGIELGFNIKTAAAAYFALTNAYPLMPQHVVMVREEHIPQATPFLNGGDQLENVLADLVELAVRLPGYTGFYNGEGAGASIPGHLHLHFFCRPEGYGDFPLEAATRNVQTESPFLVPNYPVAAVCWRSKPETIVKQVTDHVRTLIRQCDDPINFSANIFSVFDRGSGNIQLIFVPRNQMKSHSQELVGAIGGVEVLGELVFSTDSEKHRLDKGEIDYHTVERILSSISVPVNL